MPNRRKFLQRSCVLLAGGLLPHFAVSAPKGRIRIGAQTNTWGVPIEPFGRLLEVVDSLGRLGYQGFETNYNSLKSRADQAAQCRQQFEARHVPLIAAHTGAQLWDRNRAASEVETLRHIAGVTAAMGAEYIIVSGRRLPHVQGKLDENAAHNKMEALNRLGQVCQKEGMNLCYHNHHQEFEDTPSEMSFLLRETDPKLVRLNYDVGNSFGVGPDAGSFSAEHFRRIAIYHIKDVQRGADGKVVPTDLGAGLVDLKAVVAPVLQSDWRGWLTVEREGSYPHPAAHPEELVRQCRQYLKQITGV